MALCIQDWTQAQRIGYNPWCVSFQGGAALTDGLRIGTWQPGQEQEVTREKSDNSRIWSQRSFRVKEVSTREGPEPGSAGNWEPGPFTF